jgi:hypothetical protein
MRVRVDAQVAALTRSSGLMLAGTTVMFFLQACSIPKPGIAGMPDAIDYNWHVRPILSENCFQCHGPDADAREADLRLDVAEFAVAELEGGSGRYAIVPGNAKASVLIERITHASVDERMPPQSTRKSLTELEIAILARWIDEGAQYRQHWAFIAPEAAPVPATRFDDRVVNEIDSFVFDRLESKGATPADAADRETLINRVSLTLTGLPPALDAVDAFIGNDSEGAYEELVDRLLASPRYAEHMAAYWMDLARWSETDGFLDDHHDRVLWPWRDWVIDAFDRNMPFDEFGTWQLAGDLLPGATQEQRLATAFLRIGKRTTENGAIDDEYKVEYMVERTDNALGTAFMGLTLGCARCHDHKYDPITQRDYYSLGAFFNSNDEWGVYAPGFSGVQGGPTLAWADEATAAAAETARRRIAEAEAAWLAARRDAESAARAAARLRVDPAALIDQALSNGLAAHYAFESSTRAALEDLPAPRPRHAAPWTEIDLSAPAPAAADGRPRTPEELRRAEIESLSRRLPRNYVAEEMTLIAATTEDVPPAVFQAPLLDAGVVGQALFFDATNKGFLGLDVGWYDRTEPFSLAFWFYAAEAYENVPVVSHRSERNAGETGYTLKIQDGHLMLRLAHSPPANMIALRDRSAFPTGEWTHVAVTYDGSSRAAGTRIYVNGAPADTEVIRDTLTRTMLPWTNGNVLEPFLGLTLGTRFREKAPVGSGIDELSVYGKALSSLEVAWVHDRASIDTLSPDAMQDGLTELLVHSDAAVVAAFAALTEARETENRIVSAVPQVLVMGEAPEPIPAHILNRGVYNAPGPEVSPRGLDVVAEWDESLPKNRLGLARWLFSENNPLTARVFVNRVWQMHFRRGLVETSEDFGAQGSIPTHPELLDWLTVRFIESGWDVKALHRLIVMSATYRQDSALTGVLGDEDATNRLLARGPRWRMTAEMVRDNALAISGLLVGDVGGPSTKPYQPDDIWTPGITFYTYPDAEDVPPADHHRRTLYTFIKRNALHPALKIFDFRNRTESIARRRSSNTPLQALTLMNDPQFVEAYREVAARVLRSASDGDERLRMIYRLGARMTPRREYLELLRNFYDVQYAVFSDDPNKRDQLLDTGVTPADSSLDATELAAMTSVAALVMNSPDAYTVR